MSNSWLLHFAMTSHYQAETKTLFAHIPYHRSPISLYHLLAFFLCILLLLWKQTLLYCFNDTV